LWIHAQGASQMDQGKAPKQQSLGEGAEPGQEEGKMQPMKAAASKFAGSVGKSIYASPDLGGKQQDRWDQANESIYHWANTTAHDLGGKAKFANGMIGILSPGEEVDGSTLPVVIAEWGRNLISWHIFPFAAKPGWSATNTQFYDIAQGLWNKAATSMGAGGDLPGNLGSSVNQLPHPAPNKSQAGNAGEGEKENSSSKSGSGHAVINGEPSAHANGFLQVTGVRPGVDGQYLIIEADHIYSREDGYTTRLELDRPYGINSGGAWSDQPLAQTQEQPPMTEAEEAANLASYDRYRASVDASQQVPGPGDHPYESGNSEAAGSGGLTFP
jgi:hypothetical protein